MKAVLVIALFYGSASGEVPELDYSGLNTTPDFTKNCK
jgi:hypothetical protein